MFFQPTVGISGYAGWRVLEKTAPKQQEQFERSPVLTRDIEYFRENISSATTAEGLVNDRRLLTVALGAFGLADEIDKRGLIKKILEDGTENDDAFANRFNDPRFQAFATAFGYGNTDGIENISTTEFQEDIIARYKVQEFERAIGESDNDMRLALNFKREISAYTDPEANERTAWFRLMGQQPLRELIATALNIPTAVSQVDVDRQQEIFADKAEKVLGDSSLSMFQSPEAVDDVIRRFFVQPQLQTGPSESTPGFAALTLLQSGGLGAASTAGLILSQA